MSLPSAPAAPRHHLPTHHAGATGAAISGSHGISGRSAGNFSGLNILGRSFRRLVLRFRGEFAQRFSAFLDEGFASHEEIAIAFGVDVSTARKWASGLHQPLGFAVGLAFTLRPALAAKWLLMGGCRAASADLCGGCAA